MVTPRHRPMRSAWRSGPSIARVSVSTIMLQGLAPRRSRLQSQACPRTTSPSMRSSCGFARPGSTSTNAALSWPLARRSLESMLPSCCSPLFICYQLNPIFRHHAIDLLICTVRLVFAPSANAHRLDEQGAERGGRHGRSLCCI